MKRIITTIVVVIGLLALIGWMLNKQEGNDAKTAVVAQTGGAIVVKAAEVAKQPIVLDFFEWDVAANQDLTLLRKLADG